MRALLDRLAGRRAARFPAHVSIGRHTYGLAPRNLVRPTAAAPITVGAFCSVGPDVLIFGQADHPTQLASTFPFRAKLLGRGDVDATTRGGVVIGNDVWIGARAMVLSGLTVGDGAVIGAGAIVTRDVPAYAVVAGNPARQLRLRFDEATIAALLALRWWDWPDARIAALEDAFHGPIEAFLIRAGETHA
ncbi:CatB-related O-acetyltransferase [Elioraea sp.]|uniref:CatB-related O-acetyltransferase n=1 Tax=Elioraea sp. TaxID=2185103 RepID=UPI0025BD5D73|nr:CatB-related O-acetyltransferase [Elioraea sp.]